MSQRPPSAAGRGGRVGTASGRRPGTASRLAAGGVPGTAAMRGGGPGGGVALTSSLQVTDRPITQQGLGGLKTASRGPQRQIQDRSYWANQLRQKINELSTEIRKINADIEETADDQGSYVSYERRAEALAAELKTINNELGVYNILIDKINTDENVNDIQMDLDDLKTQNDREAKSLEGLFAEKKEAETSLKSLEMELQQEKSMTENMIAGMNSDMRQQYMQLNDVNEHLLKQLERQQQQLDELNLRKKELEDELAQSPVKQEAVRLYDQLSELEAKRDQLLIEQQQRGTPQEEREKLLRQVKEDNQEIASMERQTNDLREKVTNLQDETRQLDMDIEENQGERNQKYKELKKREETMDEFLSSFEDQKAQETERVKQLEQDVVLILEHLSRNLSRNVAALPSKSELGTMKDDLTFKEGEMAKSRSTASGLAEENQKLHQDLQKVEQLESKITQELEMLKEKINTMESELITYSDLDKLRSDAEAKKQRLGNDKIVLAKRRETFKQLVRELTSQYEQQKGKLYENETHTQLENLERKWQHHEQNNFVMKEFISAKTMECDYRGISKKVNKTLEEYNAHLQSNLQPSTNY